MRWLVKVKALSWLVIPNYPSKTTTSNENIGFAISHLGMGKILDMWENTLVQVLWNYESWLFFIPGWADNYGKFDPSLFYQNKLHLIQKRKIMVSESIITATEGANSDQNTLLKLVIKSLTKASNKPFPRETRYFLETLLLSIYKILPNRSYLILLVTFQLNWNIILFVNLSCRFEQVAVNVSFAPVSVFQRINVARLVFCHPHLSFLANCQPCSSCDCL